MSASSAVLVRTRHSIAVLFLYVSVWAPLGLNLLGTVTFALCPQRRTSNSSSVRKSPAFKES